jgi:glycosyltransferase involved in cell wall biosynthesis
MIVRDEQESLPGCLASVAELAPEIVIVDTGSSDRTREVAAGLGARVIDFPWCDDFAAARSEGLRHATGDWILWLDADERLDDANRARLQALLGALPEGRAAYSMQQRSAGPAGPATLVDQVRLFRRDPAVRWEYRVHEQLLPSLRRAGYAVHSTDIVIEHTGYQDAAVRRRKLRRNLRLLHLDQRERPDDAFVLFNLGWAYLELGRDAEAIPLLQRSLQRSQPADSIVPKLYALLA